MIRLEASYRTINFYILFIPLMIFIYADLSKATEIIFESSVVSTEEIDVPIRSNQKTINCFTSCFSTPTETSTPTVTSTPIKSWKYEDTKVAVFTFQGNRDHVEDRFHVDENFGDTGVSVYAIFDGHSKEFAAMYVENTLMKSLKEKIKNLKQSTQPDRLKKYMNNDTINYETLLKDEILAVEEELLKILKGRMKPLVLPIVRKIRGYENFVTNNDINYNALLEAEEIGGRVKEQIKDAMKQRDSGTTAFIAVIDNGKLFVANVGDSRGVMINNQRVVQDLSEDHKPEKKEEKKRIKEANGEVKCDKGSTIPRIDGLSVSRTIGDLRKKLLKHIIADPDTFEYDLNKFKPKFMMLASDGLWDRFSSEQALQYINDRLDTELFGAKDIALKAYEKGSDDNITILIVKIE